VELNKRKVWKRVIKIKRARANSNAIKNLGERKFSKDPAIKKRIMIKEDGRYLIYYDFDKRY